AYAQLRRDRFSLAESHPSQFLRGSRRVDAPRRGGERSSWTAYRGRSLEPQPSSHARCAADAVWRRGGFEASQRAKIYKIAPEQSLDEPIRSFLARRREDEQSLQVRALRTVQ